MDPTTETATDAPPRRARRKKPARAAKPRQSDPLAGLTVSECAKACHDSGGACCAITGYGRCGHPRKGGLQGRELVDPAITGRFKQAQRLIGKKLLDARYDKN